MMQQMTAIASSLGKMQPAVGTLILMIISKSIWAPSKNTAILKGINSEVKTRGSLAEFEVHDMQKSCRQALPLRAARGS